MKININQILSYLDPRSDFIWGYFLFAIIILAVVVLLMQKRGDLQITIFMSIPILMALIDKVAVTPAGQAQGPLDRTSFFTFVMRIAMFVFPFITAGMTKWEKSRLPAVLTGIVGLVYMFVRWFFEQRGA